MLEKLANPELIQTMEIGEKISGGLMVTALGMGITFIVLMLLWFSIVVMSRLINGGHKNPHETPVVIKPMATAAAAPVVSTPADDEDLIAVITAAVAASLNTSMHNIIVRNITEYPTRQAAWSRAGVAEQIQTRY